MATTDTVRIRRYPNRRLYDRNTRSYVTLQDIEDLVQQGRTIEVLDSKTGEDLTRQILTQILLERHPEKMDMFPVPMLHGLLQANDLVVEFWRSCLRQSLATLEQLQGSAAPSSSLTSPLAWMSTLWPAWPPRETATTPHEAELEERVAELEARIQQLEGENPDSPATPPPAKPRPRKARNSGKSTTN